ncbi:MAG: DUF4974 domain-containing protein [Bacteroidetes bacterium]|nr:DUF4974 domain-containing protein [Bacteroidota bacterium]MCL6103832.1 DUF4974 domain-containing protein [Bacteroidota bacterium]
MLNQIDIDRIEHYVCGVADESEGAYVEALFSRKQENPGLLNHLEKDWENELQQCNPANVDLNHLLDHIHRLIRNREHNQRKSPVHRFIRLYSKVAAILLLPLFIAGALTYGYLRKSTIVTAGQMVSSEIHAPYGARVSFNLPDGTTGWLNSGSSLTYTLPFNNNRKVSLDGEAWFDVVHNEKNPFSICTDNSTVKVLGTSFNVSAYRREHYIEVVLQQGKVEFYHNNLPEKVILSPSQKMVFKDGKVDLSMTDPSKYKAWTDGKLVFRGDNMEDVARRIERWYNVKVILADQDLEKYSFRGTFEDDSLEEVLRLLSLTSPIGYTIAPRVMKSDGTFEKEIVTLYKKANKNNKNQEK